MYKKICPICGKEFQTKNYYVKTCSLSCGHICRAEAQKKRLLKHCVICGKEFFVRPSDKRKTCSKECRYVLIGKKREGVPQTEFCKENMRKNNPMWKEGVVQKMLKTKEMNGTLHVWKGKRGGNGTLSEPQKVLLEELGEGWIPEFPVTVPWINPYRKINRLSHTYKVDIGNPMLKVAIEVDGKAHSYRSVQQSDLKRTERLKEVGWKVFRFTNAEITKNCSEVVTKIKTLIKDL